MVNASTPQNLLRNGSFEGSLLYWHGAGPAQSVVERKDAPSGKYVFRSEKGWVLSSPMLWQMGRTYTITLSARADTPGELHVQVPPTAREKAQATKRIWDAAGTQVAKVDKTWKRFSFVAKADLPTDGFWVAPMYALFLEGTVPVEVDAITITEGTATTKGYMPRRRLEVLSEVRDMPSFKTNGSFFEPGQTLKLTAHVSNATAQPAIANVRFQLIDYEGTLPRSTMVERKLTLAPGQTLSETVPMKLGASGTVLSRVSAWLNGKLIDQSDVPVTSLPYPQKDRKPDPRERFGASFLGPKGAKLGAKLGFGWSRWYPPSKWQDTQPDNTNGFRSYEKEIRDLEATGMSTHVVLYGWPKWIMDDKHPLPKDMRWKGNDPRWGNLKLETAWDRYIKKVVQTYRGRSVVYEIENEPELDHWDKLEDEYAKFTIRTARLIKQVDPKAKVMVNNLYTIPSGLNRRFLEAGGAKYIDIMSWHEYHEGWLADELIIGRMRTALDQLGGKHVEIWFNEGWTFTNTAVDEPPAATRLTSAQSTNAAMASVVELTATGQDKTILFLINYEEHGMSFWDYYGPGTSLWDWYGFPLPLAGAWNVLNHHLGLSERVGSVRPPGANLRIFQDLRNRRGVIVAYADREARSDIKVELPFSDLIAEDPMGNKEPVSGRSITLSKTGRPVYIYSSTKLPGKDFLAALKPQDRSLVSLVDLGSGRIHFPPVWAGKKDGVADGNPQMHLNKPIWRLDQVYPDVEKAQSYRPLTWDNGWWKAKQHTFGDQPKAEMKEGGVRLEFRAPNDDSPKEKLCALVFIAPKAGRYRLQGNARLNLWDGSNPVALTFLRKSKEGIQELQRMPLAFGKNQAFPEFTTELAAGEELVVLPRISGELTGGDVQLRELEVVFEDSGPNSWSLPETWKPSPQNTLGNPYLVDNHPVFRLDRLAPFDLMMAESYTPLAWNGTNWSPQGVAPRGQASAEVKQGIFQATIFGPEVGKADKKSQQTVALVFMAQRAGIYRIRGLASAQSLQGKAASHQLVLLNKDTQRAVTLKVVDLPSDGAKVAFDVEVELASGHELCLVPTAAEPGSSAKASIEAVSITAK
ncbi:MAG: hypothetical protein SFV15_01145 [Polyangiaceae bacterium]|nr:hypothetical protein [Polyangiaceae bacterium]